MSAYRVAAIIAACILAGPAAAQNTTRPLRSGDLFHLRTVNDPQLSPDGAWVAFTVGTTDSAKDRNDSDVWMVSWDGQQTIRVTSTPDGESSPRWSPDGRYLAFLSGRQEGKGSQLWLLDRRGGEAQRVTNIRGGISDYAWSPDAKRIAFVVDEETDSAARRDTAEKKTPKPIVIDRYHFKQDVAGYLGTKRSHLELFDVASRKIDTLTSGSADDDNPSWSPDGQRIAFVRRPLDEPAAPEGSDIYVVDARAGAAEKRLTDFPGPDGGRPSWSADGRWIAFTRGDEPKFSAYHENRLAVVAADGSAPARIVTAAYDRPISSPRFVGDASVLALTADDRAQRLVRITVADGAVNDLVAGKRVVAAYTTAADGRIAALVGTTGTPNEIYAVEQGSLRRLTHQNDSLLAQLRLSTVEDFSSRSRDGTEVHGLLHLPAGATKGSKLPLILYIHGGPNGQDSYSLNFDRELFAANGYAVLAVNYRGSSGRGSAYQKAIFADWGDKEVMDLLGAVDEAVREGVADPDRLGIGGWSYGGILTDYTTATTPRFKAAVAGAGSALQLSMYGTDQYISQYNLELGPPWKSQDLWIKLSYPFFHADRIRTPTLYMGGQSDFNVPVIGGEQMYQALRTLGVPTELVVYPGQFHGLTTPSYRKDRLDRFLAWYDRYLKTNLVQADR